ncbi:MAG: tRNA glutamyl-Q(34) synthetase GluQRS [Gammaproteobacteria bacterium]
MQSRKAPSQAPASAPSSFSKTLPVTPHPSLPYKGRFAPSPTGPLHFGSLVTALGSFLDARTHGGAWLLRMEDLDPPREQPGAADAILHALEAFKLHWDGVVFYQSARLDAYRATAEQLLADGLAYPCACSRREIADSGLRGLEGPVYPGTCRNGLSADRPARAIRLRVPPDETFAFTDLLQGNIHQNLASELGDFVIRRADGYFAYQLAVVLDDAFQSVTHVVRGADLLLSTPRQIYLQRLLGLPTPIYMHLPVAINAASEKLSKQTGAAALDSSLPGTALFDALRFLEQNPPVKLRDAPPQELLNWAISHWQAQRMQGLRTREITIESR